MRTSRNILVCEDDPVQLKVVEAVFRRAGYETRTARGPGEALEIARGRRPDAVVADVQLEGGNAFDLVEGLRRFGMDAPVVMMSAYATPGMRRRAVEAGAAGFFEKPCDPGSLVRRVEEAMEESRRAGLGARILLVEDHPQVRALLSAFLRQSGAAVLEAADGPQALALLGGGAEPPDLALVDMHVPGPSGADLIREIRRAVPGLFVAMVTGEADHTEIQAGYRAGASALIRKPVDHRVLAEFVRTNLKRARASRRAALEARRRAAEPPLRRLARKARSYLAAPRGSRRHRRLVSLGVGLAFVVLGFLGGRLVDSGARAAREYQAKVDHLLEVAAQEAGLEAGEARSHEAFRKWYLGQQIHLAREAQELSRRQMQTTADLQMIRGFQR